jgi:hypothetical protein
MIHVANGIIFPDKSGWKVSSALKKMPNYNFNLTIYILKIVLNICFLISVFICKTNLECLLLNGAYNVVSMNLEIGNK